VGAMVCVMGDVPTGLHAIKIWTVAEQGQDARSKPIIRELIANVKTSKLFDLHSFGLSSKYVTVFEDSPEYKLMTFMKEMKTLTLVDTICDWQDKMSTPESHVVRINRETGNHQRFVVSGLLGKVEHTASSWDLEDGSTVVDLTTEEPGNGAAWQEGGFIQRLMYNGSSAARLLNAQRLMRCVVPPSTGTVNCSYLSPLKFGGFFGMNARMYQQPYNFLYIHYGNQSFNQGFSDGILKFDVQSKQVAASTYDSMPAGRFVFNEPRFIELDDATQEDDGVVVASCYDTVEDESWQAIFNAKDMSLLGKWALPKEVGRLRLSLHGMHCLKDSDAPCQRY